MVKKEIFRIQPRRSDDDAVEEAFELSDIDHALPKIYTLLTVAIPPILSQ